MDDGQREQAIAELTRRITSLERRTSTELAALRVELAALGGPAHVPWQSEPKSAAGVPATRAQPDLSWLVGPRGFALAGGVVTLLGFAFLFALAASRGWVGPGVRCVFGVALSLSLIGVGVAVKRRFAHDISARAAVGTGIGGLHRSLFAATRLYHLLPQELAWAAVVAVGVLAVAFALAWSSEVLASLGLLTSAIAPPLVAGQLTSREVGAAAVAAGAALAVGQARSWRFVGLATYAVGLGLALVYLTGVRSWLHQSAGVAVASVFFTVALLGAVAYQRREPRLSGTAVALASSTLPLGLLAVHQLCAHRRETESSAAPATSLRWFSSRSPTRLRGPALAVAPDARARRATCRARVDRCRSGHGDRTVR